MRGRRPLILALQLLVSAGLIAVLVWQIDIGRTVDLIRSSNPFALFGAWLLYVVATVGLAWRWQALLESKGIQERLRWLTKLYFVGYAAGQVLPTSFGGDAVRIAAHVRRRPTRKGEVVGAVLMERVLGAVGTLVLVAFGLVIAVGRFGDVEALVWLEAGLTAVIVVVLVLLFSRRANDWLQERGGTRVLARGFRSVWLALHGYREKPRVLGLVLAATLCVQLTRIASIWLCAEAVGLDLSPLVYVILGPLLFLVMLVPFTINGLGVREAFFIAFLRHFDVSADAAFATGFLFYVVTIASSAPGGLILLWESIRPAAAGRRRITEPDSSARPAGPSPD